jgi:hypothetical protein
MDGCLHGAISLLAGWLLAEDAMLYVVNDIYVLLPPPC